MPRKKKKKKISPTGGKPGRVAKSFPFEVAKRIVRDEGISSVCEYRAWWLANHPARMPKRPERAYRNRGFTKWSEFLGSTNKFRQPRKSWASYEEARKFAQSKGIKTKMRWRQYCKENQLPPNISPRPDWIYFRSKDWISWKQFLQTPVEQTPEYVKKIETYLIIYKELTVPNLYVFVKKITTDKNIINECRNILDDGPIYAVYKTKEFDYMKLLTRYRFASTNACYIQNLYEIIYDFDLNMENCTKYISDNV